MSLKLLLLCSLRGGGFHEFLTFSTKWISGFSTFGLSLHIVL
jgi:hypothetical protein